MAIRREYVADLYRNLLGREGSDQEIEGHLNNPGGEEGLRQFFLGSPEYTSQHGGTQTWQDVGGVVQPYQEPTSHAYDTQGDSGTPSSYVAPVGSPSQPSAPTTANWNQLHGFDATNYYDPNMGSMKYNFARIAADYDPTKPGALQAVFNDPRFRQAFPNAKLVGKDSIDFGGQLSDGNGKGVPVGVVDVGEAFIDNQSGKAWQWLDNGNIANAAGAGSSVTQRPSTTAQNLNSLQALGQFYGGPGGPGINNGPLQQIGQDPLSQLITGGLADFLGRGGTTPLGSEVNDYVMGLLDDNPQINRRFESARELMEKGRRTQTNDARAALANRGLLSEPGIPQGAEIGAVKRIEEALAPEFSRALRDIYTDETTQALSLATGMASDQAKQFLAGIGEGTARQTALAQIALQSLGQNMAWSQFLAEFGLKRDQVLQELQNGRVDDVMQLLNAFLSMASLSRGGYIGG